MSLSELFLTFENVRSDNFYVNNLYPVLAIGEQRISCDSFVCKEYADDHPIAIGETVHYRYTYTVPTESVEDILVGYKILNYLGDSEHIYLIDRNLQVIMD
jgi:hypothetical protein